MFEDKQLLTRLRAGDKMALRHIYEKYIDDLLRVALSLLSDIQSAEDCLHDVFVDFAGANNSLMIHSNLKSYLISCVANRARNLNRARQRREGVGLDEIGPMVSDFKRPEQWIIYGEEFKRLNDAMAKLAYEQKEAIMLRIQGKMKFREIAKLQETSVKTALSRYRYGLNRLRSILNGEVVE